MTSVRELPVLDQPDVVACCAPLSAEALGEADAQTLSRQFAAGGPGAAPPDLASSRRPTRGRLACDLVEPVRKSQPTVSTTSRSCRRRARDEREPGAQRLVRRRPGRARGPPGALAP